MRVITEWPASARAWERCRQSLAGGVSTGLRAQMRPHPIFFSHGQGSSITDVDGNTYVDYVLGWGPLILGHSHPGVVAAVGAQLPQGQTFGSGHLAEYAVAEQVCAAIPGVERVLWSNTGTEAVQVALRLARAVTGRWKFLKFEGHYHGWSDQVLVSYQAVEEGRPKLTSRGQNPSALDDVLVAPWNDAEQVAALLRDRDVAAVICEPVLCNSGVIPPADGFLARLREVCDETGTILVFDEVITGFRLAYGGAVERYAVRPDLVVLGKAIAGGFPLSAVGGRADIVDQVTEGVVHAGTFNGNPIVLAAASATLGELRRDGVYDVLEKRAATLADGFAASLRGHGVAAAVHHVGPVVQCSPGVVRVGSLADFLAADWEFYDALSVELLRRGVFVLPRGRWYLSTAHDDRDVADTLAAFDAAVEAVVRDRD
ncbi:aspartate aminotransferase family protein [Actinopolymorpha alba]|uniref:aspartate aminotransferase family protein n=1 Tax=Actinopolymorpha alba TaxID=533267 RepID=UPI00039B3F0F|nr:aspartate aminotransferase family protein [Actinopolymorpha alba]